MSNCFPIRDIPLRFIRTNSATQARVAMDQGAIQDYVDAMKEGARFPPVTLFQDADVYWLGDGFHRVEAAQLSGKKNIKSEIRQGGLREAQLFAIGANHEHGLRRSNADKRKAVSLLLEDPEWGSWSNREIARVAGVTHWLVNEMRKERVEGPSTPGADRVPETGNTCSNTNMQEQPEPAGGAGDAGSSPQVHPETSPEPSSRTEESHVPAAVPQTSTDQQVPPSPAPAERTGPAPALPLTPSGNAALELTISLIKTAFHVPEGEAIIPFIQALLAGKDEQIAELERKLEEAASQVVDLHEENQSLHRVLDAEDLLGSYQKEVKSVAERARVAEARVRGLMNEAREAKTYASMWKRKHDALEKRLGKAEPKLAEVV